MRESGMTNMQIAKQLDVGYSTICRYLGKAPSWTRAEYGSNKTVAKDVTNAKEKPPVLKCVSRILEFEGREMRYVVLPDAGAVRISLKSGGEELQRLDKAGLEMYITELIDLLGMLEPSERTVL
jgi:DNA-binding CsgD family transcriptional regulator